MAIEPGCGFLETADEARAAQLRALLTDLPSTQVALVRAALEMRAEQLSRALQIASGAIYRSDFDLPALF